MTVSNEFSGYVVCKAKLEEGRGWEHCLFMKEHKVRERVEGKPPGRTLFVLGLPPYAHQESLTEAFSTFGKVEAVHLHSSPSAGLPPRSISTIFRDHPQIKGYKVGYVVFENSLGLSNALSVNSQTCLVLSTPQRPILLGIDRLVDEYNSRLVDPEAMSKEVDSFMEEFDSRTAVDEEKLKTVSQEMDDQGWTTVTKRSRKAGFSRKESVTKNIMRKEEAKRSKKQLLNFYRFQIRESKMNHLVKLRQRFAEDKKKVAMLKQSRKFRPF